MLLVIAAWIAGPSLAQPITPINDSKASVQRQRTSMPPLSSEFVQLGRLIDRGMLHLLLDPNQHPSLKQQQESTEAAIGSMVKQNPNVLIDLYMARVGTDSPFSWMDLTTLVKYSLQNADGINRMANNPSISPVIRALVKRPDTLFLHNPGTPEQMEAGFRALSDYMSEISAMANSVRGDVEQSLFLALARDMAVNLQSPSLTTVADYRPRVQSLLSHLAESHPDSLMGLLLGTERIYAKFQDPGSQVNWEEVDDLMTRLRNNTTDLRTTPPENIFVMEDVGYTQMKVILATFKSGTVPEEQFLAMLDKYVGTERNLLLARNTPEGAKLSLDLLLEEFSMSIPESALEIIPEGHPFYQVAQLRLEEMGLVETLTKPQGSENPVLTRLSAFLQTTQFQRDVPLTNESQRKSY